MTVILHWDGTSWTQVPAALGGATQGELYAVTALSPNAAWAVGYNQTTRTGLIERWNGHTWSVADYSGPVLRSIDGSSPRDVWGVGDIGGTYSSTYIEHWDGTAWTHVDSPNGVGAASGLASVDAVSANDVWAVGSSGKYDIEPSTTLIEHWDGQSWTVVPSPSPGHHANDLTGVSGDSASDAWAVGRYGRAINPDKQKSLYLHWDGTSWSPVRP